MSYIKCLNKIIDDINRIGWSVMGVGSSNDGDPIPQFAYTIGLWQSYKHPEVIVSGLPMAVAQSLLNEVGGRVKSGKSIEVYPTQHSDLVKSYPVVFAPVDESLKENIYGYFFGMSLRHYGDRVPALQMIYPDKAGNFPWEDDCEENTLRAQPTLIGALG